MIGSVWHPQAWAANTWAAGTWADAAEPVVNEAEQSVISMAIGIGMSIVALLGVRP